MISVIAPGIGRVVCFAGEAVPQATGSWVRPNELCVVSQYSSAPPGKPQNNTTVSRSTALMDALPTGN
jgi:hypothetical protein